MWTYSACYYNWQAYGQISVFWQLLADTFSSRLVTKMPFVARNQHTCKPKQLAWNSQLSVEFWLMACRFKARTGQQWQRPGAGWAWMAPTLHDHTLSR